MIRDYHTRKTQTKWRLLESKARECFNRYICYRVLSTRFLAKINAVDEPLQSRQFKEGIDGFYLGTV